MHGDRRWWCRTYSIQEALVDEDSLKALAMAMLASTMTMGIMTTAEPSSCTISVKLTVMFPLCRLKAGSDSGGSPGVTCPGQHLL